MHVIRRFKERGAPARKLADWTGRWWSLWGPVDLVPVGDRVVVAWPVQLDPFMDASEIEVTGRDKGTITVAGGFANFGEQARLIRRKPGGRVAEVYLTGARLRDEAQSAKEVTDRYER